MNFSRDFYKELLDSMTDGVYVVNRDREILYWNGGAERLTGYSADEMVGRHCPAGALCDVDCRGKELCVAGCPLSACITDGRPHQVELVLLHKQGHRVPVSVRAQPIRETNGEVVGAVQFLTDNTAHQEARQKAEAMERLAFYDPLTHSPNRRFLEMSLNTAVVEYQTHRDPFGVLLVDLDAFKEINDNFGHASGDRALCEIARTLAGAVRSTDVVGRWGGDEFLVIAYHASEEMLRDLAQRCTELIRASSFIDDDGVRHGFSASIGAALIHADEEFPSLICRADRQMYKVKSAAADRRGRLNLVQRQTVGAA